MTASRTLHPPARFVQARPPPRPKLPWPTYKLKVPSFEHQSPDGLDLKLTGDRSLDKPNGIHHETPQDPPETTVVANGTEDAATGEPEAPHSRKTMP
jgi:hypothetical protein